MENFFITGTSQGLGKALATEALHRGAVVHGMSRNRPFEKDGYTHFAFDLSETESLAVQAAHFFTVAGKPERVILINNAGTLGDVAYVGEWQSSDLARTFAVNLTAPAILINAFIDTFGDHSCEKIIINISSGAARNPYDGWSAYCSSKAGLEMYSRVLAEEIVKKGLSDFHVWSVAPGVVDTGMQNRLRESDPGQFSNLDRFMTLKSENKLTPPAESAAKILSMLDHTERFTDTVQDVRKF